jgi:TRAP-type C4-dicarboxylate transport system substrate-binding protein
MKRLAAAAAFACVLATSAVAAPIELRFASPGPAKAALNALAFETWAKEVSDASNGTIHVRIFPGPVLADFNKMYDRITSGAVDIGFGLHASIGGKFPKTDVASLPFEQNEPLEGSLALWRVYARGLLADEYRDVKVLGLFTFGQAAMHSIRPIHSPADLVGMKMRSGSKLQSDMELALGIVPLNFNPADAYEALNRGAIQGVAVQWTGFTAFKMQDIAKHHLEAPFGSSTGFVMMNKASYDRLPPEAKAAIDKYSGEPFARAIGTVVRNDDLRAHREVEALPGHDFIVAGADKLAEWKKHIQPAIDNWVRDTPDGIVLLQAFREEIAKIRANHEAP